MSKIPTIFKPSGVSHCQTVINKLEKGDILTMELDPNNKYDSKAIKFLNSDNEMCGFVPKKYKMEIEGKLEDIPLNVLVHQKFTKLTNKYNIIVNELYKWNGPTGMEVRFDKK
jgi:hypothetical protein